MKLNRFRFLSTVDTRILAVLLWAFLLLLPTFSMGGVQNETQAPQNRLTGYTSPPTEATYAYDDALDRRIVKTVDGVSVGIVRGASAVEALAQHGITRKSFAVILVPIDAPGDGARRLSRYHPGDHA